MMIVSAVLIISILNLYSKNAALNLQIANLIYQALQAEAQSLVAHCVKGGDDAAV